MATVFARNLPYGVTQEELEQVFGDIGPVKKVDVIKDKGKKKSDMLTRGFAFVRYAIESDAQYAVEKLNGHEFQGRRMRLEIAREKGKKSEQQPTRAPAAAAPAPVDAVPAAVDALPVKTEAEDFIALDTTRVAEPSAAVTTNDKKSDKKSDKKKDKKKDKDEEVATEPSPVKNEKQPKKEKKEKVADEPIAVKPVQPKAVPAAVKPTAKPAVATKSAQALLDEGPDFAAAQPKISADGHVQSDRNARRRAHREFLRLVEQRKNDAARAEDKSIVIYGLGADVLQKHIAKKVKKVGGKVVSVALHDEPQTGKKFATVQFEALADVQTAIAKLDHHIFKGAMLKVKRLASSSGGNATSATAAEGLRLIVRNLHFDTQDSDLETAFQVHGPLFEARVVRMPVDDPENAASNALGRSRGFGFVQFRDVADARAAVAALNGVAIRGRPMIVDFALAKSKYVEQQQRATKSLEVDPNEEDDGDADVDGEGHDDELEMASDDEIDAEEANASESESENKDNEADTTKPKVDSDAQRYRTLFLRNLSFQTDEESLKTFFATFGAVEYARIVYDHGSGLSKGVGFVRFKDAAVADRVLAHGQLAAEREDHKSSKHAKKGNKKPDNAFTLSALADGDALVLDGRMLSLTRAVAKADAERLATENASERKRADKRNLYLAYEGTINVNKLADAELQLPKLDIEKRRRAIREKKEKLKNPMYFVSPTRLSVRNLATSVDDKTLKELFRNAAVSGVRAKNVERAEVKLDLLPANFGDITAMTTAVKIKMAKVVRDTDDVKPGKEPRSRGYGFVEFAEHVHALAALRTLNNNPAFAHVAAGAKMAAAMTDKKSSDVAEKSRLIVEFALENHGKLKLREKRQQDADKRREDERALREAQGDVEAPPTEKKSRGQRQREAKKARALEKSGDASSDAVAGKPIGKPTGKTATGKPTIVKSDGSTKRKREVAPPTKSSTSAATKKQKTVAAPLPSRKDRKQAHAIAVEESFDALVRNYKREIFGEKPVDGSSAATATDNARERWFD